MLKSLFIVSLIGALGCAARILISNYFFEKFGPVFPLGTLTVNVVGCLLIGFFIGLTSSNGGISVSPVMASAITTGFLGGFTTFSSFALQTYNFLKERQWSYATLNISCSLVFSIIAVGVGQLVATEVIYYLHANEISRR
ncbi:MAG: fluoride efflux transporter FluC [Chthoniobacterales bacterium]